MTGVTRSDTDVLRYIQEFAADYYLDGGARPVTPAEQAIIEEVLVDYLLGEEHLFGPTNEHVEAALSVLDGLRRLPAPSIDEPTITLIEQCIVDLAGRLKRREAANLIMQEHLITLSEDIRRLKLRLGPGESQPQS